MAKKYKIGFIGAGTMGSTIICALINSGFILREDIIASEISEKQCEKVADELKITTTLDNVELCNNSEVIVLCTKPYAVGDVLQSIKTALDKSHLILSIAAGVGTLSIENIIGKELSVIRIMPNTPALVGEGMSAVCKGRYADSLQVKFAVELFSKIGRCIEIDEKHIDAVTGISGSGPAFIYLIIEALADGGVKLGLPKRQALELAAQTTLGAAKMILETRKHPSVLKDEVTTPGGCTIAGLMVMENNKIRAALSQTVQETARTASQLSN